MGHLVSMKKNVDSSEEDFALLLLVEDEIGTKT